MQVRERRGGEEVVREGWGDVKAFQFSRCEGMSWYFGEGRWCWVEGKERKGERVIREGARSHVRE